MTNIEPRQAWVNWAQQFLAAPKETLGTQEQALFASCIQTNDPEFPGEEVKRTFLFRLIEKRMGVIGLELDTPAITYLSLTHDNPGTVVMYLYAIKYALRSKDASEGPKQDALTLRELAHIFPSGFVDKRALQGLWDAQKAHRHNLPGDNLLDSLGYDSLWVPPTVEDAQETDGGRNPYYEGLFEGETEEERDLRPASAKGEEKADHPEAGE